MRVQVCLAPSVCPSDHTNLNQAREHCPEDRSVACAAAPHNFPTGTSLSPPFLFSFLLLIIVLHILHSSRGNLILSPSPQLSTLPPIRYLPLTPFSSPFVNTIHTHSNVLQNLCKGCRQSHPLSVYQGYPRPCHLCQGRVINSTTDANETISSTITLLLN